MKNVVYSLFALMVMVTVASCKKNDSVAPVVTLNGSSTQEVSLQHKYVELNATATDKHDGDITPTISGTVDTTHTGTYLVTYTAIDGAGNIGKAIRTVIVKNDAASAFNGNYLCTITIGGSVKPAYTQKVTASSTVNNRINFSLFSNYVGNTSIYASVSATTITLPRLLAIQIDSPMVDRTFAGVGATTSNGFALTYTDSTSTGIVTKSETFVKQ